MRRVVASAVLALATSTVLGLASGCAQVGTGGPPAGEPPIDTSPTAMVPTDRVPTDRVPTGRVPEGVATVPARPAVPVAVAERVAIFNAVLRRYLTTSDHSFGDQHRFPIVYVLDRTDAAAGDPMAAEPRDGGPGSMPRLAAITADEQAAIIAGLADVAPVEFVSDRAAVLETENDCQQVRGGGVLITLAPPRPATLPPGTAGPGNLTGVHVGIFGYVACLGATWFTYVAVHGERGWQVTGTTGPMAIA